MAQRALENKTKNKKINEEHRLLLKFFPHDTLMIAIGSCGRGREGADARIVVCQLYIPHSLVEQQNPSQELLISRVLSHTTLKPPNKGHFGPAILSFVERLPFFKMY